MIIGKKELTISLLIVFIILVVFVAFITYTNNNSVTKDGFKIDKGNKVDKIDDKDSIKDEVEKIRKEASLGDKKFISSLRNSIKEENSISKISDYVIEGREDEQFIVVAPQNSFISIETGELVNLNGEIADNSAESGTVNAPQVSIPVDPGKLPDVVTRIVIEDFKISPNEIIVNPGQIVSLAIVVTGKKMEIFKFEDESLQGVSMGVGSEQTRVITFRAPIKSGEYTFFSDMKSRRIQGIEGKLIVK